MKTSQMRNYVCAMQGEGAPIAQLGEGPTLDYKDTGSILTRGAVLCP